MNAFIWLEDCTQHFLLPLSRKLHLNNIVYTIALIFVHVYRVKDEGAFEEVRGEGKTQVSFSLPLQKMVAQS
jgi:hypothetical protein